MAHEISTAAEALLDVKFPILGNGFVSLVDYMGGDIAIESAARVSYDAGAEKRKVSETRGLIRYLVRQLHSTPLEMCVLKLHCKAPIFVARQWIRHRMSSTNELSGRYSVLPTEFYTPDASVLGFQSKTNKQGRANTLPPDIADRVLQLLIQDAEHNFETYNSLLGEDTARENFTPEQRKELQEGDGLARELARMGLPLSTMTQWYWKIDLHNLMHFLRLRCDGHAQYEIRVYADKIRDLARAVAPLAMEAWDDYIFNALKFSKQELAALAMLLHPDKVALAISHNPTALTGRELDEFRAKLMQLGTMQP